VCLYMILHIDIFSQICRRAMHHCINRRKGSTTHRDHILILYPLSRMNLGYLQWRPQISKYGLKHHCSNKNRLQQRTHTGHPLSVAALMRPSYRARAAVAPPAKKGKKSPPHHAGEAPCRTGPPPSCRATRRGRCVASGQAWPQTAWRAGGGG
jgi:hypothetical protein